MGRYSSFVAMALGLGLLFGYLVGGWFSVDDGSRPAGARTTVGKVSMLTEESDMKKEIYERALHSHDYHNKLHGYRMSVLRHEILPGYWSKPAYMLKILVDELAKPRRDRLQWLMWLDADIVLLNPSIRLETFLPPSPTWSHINVLVTADRLGLNNGVFLLRVNEWSFQLLSAVLAYQHYDPETVLRFEDQSAMQRLLTLPEFSNSTIYVPPRWFNARAGSRRDDPFSPSTNRTYDAFRDGDLLIHFPGYSARDQSLAAWLDGLDERPEQFDVPLKEMTLRDDIKKFWLVEAPKQMEM